MKPPNTSANCGSIAKTISPRAVAWRAEGPGRMRPWVLLVTLSLVWWQASGQTHGQTGRSQGSNSASRPVRAAPPIFEVQQFDGVFFDDPTAQLNGPPPDASQGPASQSSANSSATPAGSNSVTANNSGTDSGDPNGWRALISPTSLEDLIKGSKLRLDKLITTPTAFKGGGFVPARTEFSLQALLFAIIETYPEPVRWQTSAAEARTRMARVAANTKVGSDQVFTEAKTRLMDLGDLLGGASLQSRGESSQEPIEWSTLIDRVPLMQLLDWAQDKNLTKLVASESQFKDSSDEVQRFAELIAVLGQVALAEEMPDANDDDYAELSKQMIAQAQQIVLATKTQNAQLARSAAAELGQTCNRCHESFR